MHTGMGIHEHGNSVQSTVTVVLQWPVLHVVTVSHFTAVATLFCVEKERHK